MYCQCGCGTITPKYKVNNGPKGEIAGAHKRFIKGHQCRKNNPEVFWSKVKKSKGCWEWTSTKNSNGYGRFLVGGFYWQAHRYSYTISVRPVNNAEMVLHKCDNPMCVRPDHLFLGTRQDNMIDKVRKNRQNKGEDNNNKVTEQQVLEIRASNLTQKKLAAIYGMTRSGISAIKTRRCWAWLKDTDDDPGFAIDMAEYRMAER